MLPYKLGAFNIVIGFFFFLEREGKKREEEKQCESEISISYLLHAP